MSTLAVFGMTFAVAKTEARKKTAGTQMNAKAPAEWLELVAKRTEKIIGSTVRQLSPMFGAQQYAEQFIEPPHKPGKCRDI